MTPLRKRLVAARLTRPRFRDRTIDLPDKGAEVARYRALLRTGDHLPDADLGELLELGWLLARDISDMVEDAADFATLDRLAGLGVQGTATPEYHEIRNELKAFFGVSVQ